MKRQIIFSHLLNDLSGSPKVLKEVIECLHSESSNNKLYVANTGQGFLSLSNTNTIKYWYYRTQNRVVNLLTYLASQVFLFGRLLFDREINKDAIIYVNTLLPFSAGLFGWLTKRDVIYHIHEVSIAPELLKKVLLFFVTKASSLNIYVSKFQQATLPIPSIPALCIHNSLSKEYLKHASKNRYSHINGNKFNVLMIATLKDFKGIPEYVRLAAALTHFENIHFELLINDNQLAIDTYFQNRLIPLNMTIFPKTRSTSKFYSRSSLVLNLSRTDMWVETFGLTVLEAMAFGIPVIAPPVGGPAELLTHGKHGFLIDSRDFTKLQEAVLKLSEDATLCYRMSKACLERASAFSPIIFKDQIIQAVRSI